jgi:hypothetical protein
MPRTLDAALLAAMNAGDFVPYFKVQLMDSNRSTVMYETTDVKSFELSGLRAKCTFHDPTNWQDYYLFRIQRGVVIGGTPNYITSSCFWPSVDRHYKRWRSLEGHLFPQINYSVAGDVTYHSIIDTVCNYFHFNVSWDDAAAAWLNYQFIPDGRTLNLGNATNFFSILRQKYLIFATDKGADTIHFYQAKNTAPTYPGDYTLVTANKINAPGPGSYKTKSLSSIDENEVVHTSGVSTDPVHNLGYLESTCTHPDRKWWIDTPDWIVQGIMPNLKYLDFDPIRVSYDVVAQGVWPALFKEVYDQNLSPSWQWQARVLDVFGNTEGGTLPYETMSSFNYIPLNTSEFNGVLTDHENNLQSAMDKIDDHKHTSLYAPIAKGVTNGDSHNHVGGDGGQIDHGDLAYLSHDDHPQYILHSLADAANDFLVATGANVFARSTLAATKTLLGITSSVIFLPWIQYTDIQPLTSDEQRPFSATIDRTITFVKWAQAVRVSTTNNGSNYWHIKIIKCTAGTVIKEITTSAISANTNTLLSTTSFTVGSVGSADVGLYIEVYMTGSPGALFLFSPMVQVTV